MQRLGDVGSTEFWLIMDEVGPKIQLKSEKSPS